MSNVFKRAGEYWSPDEDIQLNKLYNEDMLDVMEISKIHSRPPGGIISRLCNHSYIVNRQSARGYITYKNSDLYKEIVANNDKKSKITDKSTKKLKVTKKSKTTQIDNILISINKLDYIELQNNIDEMKNEIKELKNDIKELVEMTKAVYDFENA